MLKKMMAMVLILLVLVSSSGCSPIETISYYNNVYGVEIKAEKDWIINIEDGNMSLDPDDVKEPKDMKYYDEGGYDYAQLIYMQNIEDSDDAAFADFSASMENFGEDLTMEEYLLGYDYDEHDFGEEEGELYSRWENRGKTKINNFEFYKLRYSIYTKDLSYKYNYDYYYTILGEEFFCMSVAYSERFGVSKRMVEKMLNSVYITYDTESSSKKFAI